MNLQIGNTNPLEFTVPVSGEGAFYILEESNKEFYPYFHRHKEYQISYIIRGTGVIIVDNMMQPFLEDELLLIRPNIPHVLIRDNGEDSIHVVHIFMSPEILQYLLNIPEFNFLKQFFQKIDSCVKLNKDDAKELLPRFKSLSKHIGMKRFIQVLKIINFLNKNIRNFKSLYSGISNISYKNNDSKRINEVLNYTMKHYNKDITIEKISALVHMCPTTFCKFFKKRTLKSYITFLNEVRIEMACQFLIKEDFETMADIGYRCGYNSVVHFNRVFKSIMKVSPTEFVKTHRISD